MKCTIPEISWHNRDPVLSIDIQTRRKEDTEEIERLATGGTDSHVLIWHITIEENGAATVKIAAELTRHQKAVNVVRFSPSGELLASGDDESVIMVWKQSTSVGKDEQWTSLKVLRGHVEDVYDLAWSPDSLGLISGSVDNSAILWNVQKGQKTDILSDHKGFVQGVAWNPRSSTVATLSSDRMLRVFNTKTKKCIGRSQRSALFHDDTFKSFFRRLSYSPDGRLLVAPSGLVAETETTPQTNATHVFTSSYTRPSVILPSLDNFTVAVRCCPLLFRLRDSPSTMFDLPYRMVMAVAEQKSVVLYDTQQREPFALISNIHYTRLTDLAWSSNGRLLIISSTDGYCSIVTFAADELGIVYTPDVIADKPTTPVDMDTSPVESAAVPIESATVPMDSATSIDKASDDLQRDEGNAIATAEEDAKLKATAVNIEKEETSAVNESKVEATTEKDLKVESTTVKDLKMETNTEKDSKVEPTIIKDTKVVTTKAKDAKAIIEVALSSDNESEKTKPVISAKKKVNLFTKLAEKPTKKSMKPDVQVATATDVDDKKKDDVEELETKTEVKDETTKVSGATEQDGEESKSVNSPVTPVARAPRRVALTTLASPKSKKRLL